MYKYKMKYITPLSYLKDVLMVISKLGGPHINDFLMSRGFQKVSIHVS